MVTAVNRALADDTAALTRLDALDRQVTELARRVPGRGDDGEGYQPRPAPNWWKLAADERRASVAELRDRVEHVYRPGYGHFARTLGPCWPEHDLCLYGLDIASQLWCALYLQPERSTSLLSAQAEYQIRILPAIAAQLGDETTGCGPQPRRQFSPEHAVKNRVLDMALACVQCGWFVFPCQPGQKAPATRHGYLDATTDPDQVIKWFGGHLERNLAVATGAPGPDILDIDSRGPAASGFPALERLRAAGLLQGAAARVGTPSGGLHVYFKGSNQRTAHLPASHIDFLAVGGYALIPPSQIGGRPYEHLQNLGASGHLDWGAAARLLEPARDHQRPASLPAVERISTLARWVADQREGNRNAGLFWAANRALEVDRAADLSPLATAARQAGLPDEEIIRTLNSARRTTQATPRQPGQQAEGAT